MGRVTRERRLLLREVVAEACLVESKVECSIAIGISEDPSIVTLIIVGSV